jgi:serine/threonine protein kinase/tetratricopeptide (TPR) repeat protein
MGVVWRAYDPDLDRNVAIKFVLPGWGEQGRVRMQREARALGKLSHPNVVIVYDFGVLDERIWVAMALIQGVTLSEWLAAAERNPAEIVEMFLQAGRGLAAAHVEGVTHRDFKPANVMVGHDGLVRVMDFGLARTGSDLPVAAESGRVQEETRQPAAPLADTEIQFGTDGSGTELTKAGTVLGTPPYMAPEQARGETADARSDQFSFCTSLYEALYGVRLFGGRGLERYYEVADSHPLPGSSPSGLSSKIRSVLVRGLRLDPEQRYPDMESLLLAISRALEPPKRNRYAWFTFGFGVLLVGASVAAWLSTREPAICESDSDTLEEVWNPSIARELRDAALRSDLPYAATTWTTAEHDLDDWTQRWARSQQRACEATNVEEKQSHDMLERRYACLDLQLIRVESTVAGLRRLEGSPRELLDRASQLSLPDIDSCETVHLLDQQTSIPSDEATAAEAAAVRELLAAAEGLLSVGDYEQALARGEQALERATKLEFEPVTAEAQLLVGITLFRSHAGGERAEDLLREAAWSAERSGHEAVAVRTAAALANLAGDGGEIELAEIWAGFARAALVHHGDAPSIEPEVRRDLGSLAMTTGQFETALVEYTRALELAREREGERSYDYIASLWAIGDAQRELGRYDEASETLGRARSLAVETLGAKHPMVPNVLDALANVEASRGQFGPALELHREALAIHEEIFGMQHKQVAKSLNNLAVLYDETGRYAESVETLTRARAILVQESGAKHPDVAFVDVNLGSALQNLGRHDEALLRYESALAVLEDSLGPTHVAVGVTLQNMGSARSALQDNAGALAHYERSSEVLEQAYGNSHPSLAAVELNRAKALRELKRHDEALAAAARALQMREQIFGDRHAELVEVLIGLVEIELALEHPQRAREFGERGLLLASDANTPNDRAAIRLGLGKALMASAGNGDQARARVLGREALEILATAEGSEWLRTEIEEWLTDIEK